MHQSRITAIRVLMRLSCLSSLLMMMTFSLAVAWDGQDSNTGSSVEIGKGNLVRSGQDIEVYDHSTGQYHDFTVESITGGGSSVTVEGYDNTTGEFRTFEMEPD